VHSSVNLNVHPFPPAEPLVASTMAPAHSNLGELTQLLPLPAQMNSTASRLTRMELLLLAGTGTNPKSLEVSGTEFLLFMDMRSERCWKSSDMTPQKVVEAAALYNGRLRSSPVAKSPSPRVDRMTDTS
jgi:hypothetical protein